MSVVSRQLLKNGLKPEYQLSPATAFIKRRFNQNFDGRRTTDDGRFEIVPTTKQAFE